jgi:hypothetical protein
MKGKIFNAQEVQSILAGNKTQFREVIKPQPNDQQKHISKTTFSQNKEEIGEVFLTNHDFSDLLSRKSGEKKIKCPYQVGQEIFVKEVWNFISDKQDGMGDRCYYKANQLKWDKDCVKREEDFMEKYGHTWKPAQHMKQEHSRLTLQIKEIRMEKLVDISEEDARQEGITDGGCSEFACRCEVPVDAFIFNWNATHKKPEEKFEANPWVWAISFEINNSNN